MNGYVDLSTSKVKYRISPYTLYTAQTCYVIYSGDIGSYGTKSRVSSHQLVIL